MPAHFNAQIPNTHNNWKANTGWPSKQGQVIHTVFLIPARIIYIESPVNGSPYLCDLKKGTQPISSGGMPGV